MKQRTLQVARLSALAGVCLALTTPVMAGVNAGGTIVAHDASTVYTSDVATYCGTGVIPGSCEAVDTSLDGSSDVQPMVWKVYAAFGEGSSPRLRGMTWGIDYSGASILLLAWGPCIGDPNNGAAEFPGAGWPEPNTGTSIVWQYTQTSRLVECYWFAGYNYSGSPSVFQLRAHSDPVLGGMFGDDSIPAILDNIAGFGSIGFDTPGAFVCPQGGGLEGACCIGPDCLITTEDQCAGQFQGPGVPCDPNPCEQPVGACCVGEECLVVPEAQCDGVFQGVGTTCDPNPCLIFGACCVSTDCFLLTQQDCAGQGGIWQGAYTVCDPNPCLNPNPVERTTWGKIKNKNKNRAR